MGESRAVRIGDGGCCIPVLLLLLLLHSLLSVMATRNDDEAYELESRTSLVRPPNSVHLLFLIRAAQQNRAPMPS